MPIGEILKRNLTKNAKIFQALNQQNVKIWKVSN